jgi:hypothetical protein
MNTQRILASLTRIPGTTALWRKFSLGSVETRVRFGIWQRPHYAYGCYHAAVLAHRLGLSGITVIELGVAGGSGLLVLEEIAAAVSKAMGIEIDVVGFDSGQGMPAPVDYRDLPHVWNAGFYKMDKDRLKAQLSKAELCLGPISETIPVWLARCRLPIGFVAFDLDYYSSTVSGFRLFDSPGGSCHLPRVYCYFDDTYWPEHACHNEFIGELRAIKEFNQAGEKKICPLHLLRHMRPHAAAWNDQIYIMHDFKHPLWCTNITPQDDRHTQSPGGDSES